MRRETMRNLKLSFVTLLILVLLFSISNSALGATISIKMVEPKVSIFTGATKTLKLKVANVNIKKIKWQSSNSSIVTVDSKGQIKGIKNGVSHITASLPNTKIKATTVVTVNKKALNAAEVFKKVNPSVVYIESYNKYNKKVGVGSGVIVRKDGVIVTNHHVVVDVTEISYVKVRLADGRMYKTEKVIGYDADRDLAVLKIDGVTNFTPIEMGDSNKIKTGEKIYALGSPLGKQNSVTEGIISNRSITDQKLSFIQFTAPISPGNSGGALVNVYGELIGINVAYYIKGQNMNLAIPVKDYNALNKSLNIKVLAMNQEYFIPVSGEGNTREEEVNDEYDSADEIVYASGVLNGNLKDINDFDMYYFLVTDNKKIILTGSSIDPALGGDLLFSIYDENGDVVKHGDVFMDTENNRYVCDLEANLTPGYYFIGVYALDGTTLPYNNSEYAIFYEIE
jgi:S1-C subfamily serine protease